MPTPLGAHVIGVFDSGLGGLTVAGHIRRLAPTADLLYIGDRARAPYGPRSSHEVLTFSSEITRRLLDRGAGVIVVACNTASAAALHPLRAEFPDVPFVGMEPAVKPAASHTSTGIVGVVATAGTLNGPLYESVVARYGTGVTIHGAACPDWVELVERGEIGGGIAIESVSRCLEPILARGADRIVLGCTHFPLLGEAIEHVVAGRAAIVDPGPAVARQTLRLATQLGVHLGNGRLEIELTGGDHALDTVISLVGLANPEVAVISGLHDTRIE
jgi:glutamate racemase